MYRRELALPALSRGEPSLILSGVSLLPSHQAYRQHAAEQSSPSQGNMFPSPILLQGSIQRAQQPCPAACRGSRHPACLKLKKQMLALHTDSSNLPLQLHLTIPLPSSLLETASAQHFKTHEHLPLQG